MSRIVQEELAKLLMMGSKGRIAPASPLTADERLDIETQVDGQSAYRLAVQVKA